MEVFLFMKYEEGLKVLRFNEKTGKWYKDNPTAENPWRMTVYILSDAPCEVCGEKFFYCSGNKGCCCSFSCNAKKRNAMYGISEETAKKISQANLGKKMNDDFKAKCALNSSKRIGELNGNWKGGITSENTKIYCSKEYKEWRTSVFERDNYTCVMCNERGYKLQAHHIKRFALYRYLIYNKNNGVTLCENCHYSIKKHEEDYESMFNEYLEKLVIDK